MCQKRGWRRARAFSTILVLGLGPMDPTPYHSLLNTFGVRIIGSALLRRQFATLVFTGVSEHVVQMGFYHLKNDPVGHRYQNMLSVSTACNPRPALSSHERRRSAFVFDPGRGSADSESLFHKPCAGPEARIKAQQMLPELKRPRRYLAEHVDALVPKSTNGAIRGASSHLRAANQQIELECRILALYKAGFSLETIRKVIARQAADTPDDVETSASRIHKGGDKQIQTACVASFSPSHSLENPILTSQISAERSPSSSMSRGRSSGRKTHLKLSENEQKKSTEIDSKRERRRNEARGTIQTGQHRAPEAHNPTCSRATGRPSRTVISKLRVSVETRNQRPSGHDPALQKHGCASSATPRLISIGLHRAVYCFELVLNTRIYAGLHTTTLPGRGLERTAQNKHCSHSDKAPILGFAPSVRTRAPNRIQHEPFGDPESVADVVLATVPMLSADSRVCPAHSRSTCAVLSLLMPSGFLESSLESLPTAVAPQPKGCILDSESSLADLALPKHGAHSVPTLPLQLGAELSRIPYVNTQTQARVITVSGIETPNETRFLTATFVDDNGLIFSQFPMQLISFDSSRSSIMDLYHRTSDESHVLAWIYLRCLGIVPGNSSLDLISVAAHPVRPRHLIGRMPVFKPGAGIGAATMLGRSVARGSVQGGRLAPAALGSRNPITGLSLLRHCRLRMTIVASRHHLLVHRRGVISNSTAVHQVHTAPRPMSRAHVARHSNVPFMVQSQYNSGSPEYIPSALEELAVVTVDRFSAIGIAHEQCDTMSWLYSKLPRHGNTGSCVTQQYTLAKTEKGKDGNIHVTHSRSASDMFQKIGLTHTREDSDDIRRGIEFLRDRKILASLNSGSVEYEGWHNQQHNSKLLAGTAKYKPLHRGNHEWIRVFHHSCIRENKINADRVPIATPLAAPDVSQELGHGKLRERSEDTQKLCAYPAGLIKDAATYEPCYLSDGQIRNGGARYCPTISHRFENTTGASCALLPPSFTDLDEFKTSCSWFMAVNPVLDVPDKSVFLSFPEQQRENAISGDPLYCSTKCCSENNSINLPVTLARTVSKEVQNDEITERNFTVKMARSQQSKHNHVYHGSSDSAEVPPRLVKQRVFNRTAAGGAYHRKKKLAAASPCINFVIESTLELKEEVYSLRARKSKGRNTLLLISHPEGCDGGEGIYVPFDELPQGTQNLPKILSTGSMILGKVLNSEYCSEYQARACPVYTAELVRVEDRATRVQQRENFETLEIGVGGKAADKQTQILCRSLGSHQRSVGFYLNYILVAQKFSSNCSLSRFTDYGASKLRNHSLQAPEYGAVGQYSKTSSEERNETRSRHPDESSGHPVIAYSLLCSTSPSPPPLAAQSLPANHSSSLGVPISHHQRADGYASPPGSSGSMKTLYPPSPSPTPPAKLVVLRFSSDHPTSTNNIHSNTSSPLRNPSSCSLPSNSLCNNTSTQDKTREDITRSSPNLLAVVIAPNLSRFLRHTLFPPFSTSSPKHAQSAARNSREYAIPRTAHIYRTPEPNPSEGHDYRDITVTHHVICHRSALHTISGSAQLLQRVSVSSVAPSVIASACLIFGHITWRLY
ncbi:hypothetical protein B0H13DRAFT_1924058 [Mycena leptocephala]|nr:hypothetical protein B0H13DRAFT_1924058 [Mycena leptocephala]